MFRILRSKNIPESFIQICENIYDGSSHFILTNRGPTPCIPIVRGIKQGCPLSPLLFNFVLEGVLPLLSKRTFGYTFSNGSKVNVLAFADDLCLVGDSGNELQDALDLLQVFLEWAGMTVNPAKCSVLSIANSGARKYVKSLGYSMNRSFLPSLNWEDRYRASKLDELLTYLRLN